MKTRLIVKSYKVQTNGGGGELLRLKMKISKQCCNVAMLQCCNLSWKILYVLLNPALEGTSDVKPFFNSGFSEKGTGRISAAETIEKNFII